MDAPVHRDPRGVDDERRAASRVGGRVEQALLLGVRARGFSISTMQGMSRTGNGGIALYGHGTLGFQLGYLF